MSLASFDFGSRKRTVLGNGQDFEDFVFECFSIASNEPGFEKRLARGRDGAVDLADRISDPGGLNIAECKFIGSGNARDALPRWNEVFRNLKNNLPALRQNKATRLASPYRAWLNPERIVVGYRFCITARMSDFERNELEVTITSDFLELANGGIEELRTLASTSGAVQVVRWDWFHGQLELNPALAFRWFRGLPKGIESFDFNAAGETTFRSFLTGGGLRYFSRDEYVEQLEATTLERGEARLVSELAGQGAACLLISGPGGVGKTRLALELAGALGSAEPSFDAYRLNRSAGFASLQDLAAHYPKPASIVLVADYAEAVPNLVEIAEAASFLEANAGHRIRLIATCRSSAANQVRDGLAVLNLKQVSLASPLGGEDAYADWVTRSILGLEPFSQLEELARVCHGVPALAAFAVYLFRHHRAAFDNQFGALLAIDDFASWVQHRIALLIDAGGQRHAQERMLARIGLALPCRREHLLRLANDETDLIERLFTDRWIEAVDDECFAAHDVLADALVGRWLFAAEHAATERAISLLADAAERNALLPALVALERQAQDPRFGAISGASIAGMLGDRYRHLADQWCGPLLDGRLLDFIEKLNLLNDDDLIQPMVAATPVLDVKLCRIAQEANRSPLHPISRAHTKLLADLLELALCRPQYSNMVLRRAYALDPDRFRDGALQNVRDFPRAEPTHFLLVQLLLSGEPPDQLRQQMAVWLERNDAAIRARFLYRAWFEKGGALEPVEAAMLAWIDKHGASPEASFVYAAWLNATRGVEAVSAAVRAWIDEHHLLREADFVYRAWLEVGGDYSFVENAIGHWVSVWHETHDFVFLSKFLSKRRDLSEPLVLAIAAWCAAFPLDDDTLYRLSSVLIPFDKVFTPAGASRLAQCVDRVFAARTTLAPMDAVQCWSICCSLGDPRFYNLNPFAVLRSIASIVRSGRVFSSGLDPVIFPALAGSHGQIAQMVMYGLRQGELGIDADREALQQFASWLKCCCSEPREAEILLGRLNATFASPIWR